MEDSKILQAKRLLYDLSNEEVMSIIFSTDDMELLYTYLYNYNWDDGFEIPQIILDNEKCDLSTALLIIMVQMGWLIYKINQVMKICQNGKYLKKNYTILS